MFHFLREVAGCRWWGRRVRHWNKFLAWRAPKVWPMPTATYWQHFVSLLKETLSPEKLSRARLLELGFLRWGSCSKFEVYVFMRLKVNVSSWDVRQFVGEWLFLRVPFRQSGLIGGFPWWLSRVRSARPLSSFPRWHVAVLNGPIWYWVLRFLS